jgi:preprotein translocase subunit SecB
VTNSNKVSATRRVPISPEAYGEFIGQIQLRNLFLKDAFVRNIYGSDTPDHVSVELSSSAEYQNTEQGFDAIHHYEMDFSSGDTVASHISVTFSVGFESTIQLTDEMFETFREVNLPVNTWPYLREFVSSTLGRMNWQPFALPALMRGLNVKESEPKPRPRRTRKKSTADTTA